MQMKKGLFIGIAALILGCYGVANVILFFTNNGFHYFETDLFLIATSLFFFFVVLVLPRTVLIMLGAEREDPGNQLQDKETSDLGDASRCPQTQ